jgi:hypothetical protein
VATFIAVGGVPTDTAMTFLLLLASLLLPASLLLHASQLWRPFFAVIGVIIVPAMELILSD